MGRFDKRLDATILLIPKRVVHFDISTFGPISLARSFYNIPTKDLANWLNQVLAKVMFAMNKGILFKSGFHWGSDWELKKSNS